MKYLIVKCEELDDGWECDARRTPMYITDNWKKKRPKYPFEVYEILSSGSLKLIKHYDN